MAKKKEDQRTLSYQYLGSASVILIKIHRDDIADFKKEFEAAFKNPNPSKDSNKIADGIFCEVRPVRTEYVHAFVAIPEEFPSKFTPFMVSFTQRYKIKFIH